MSLNVAIFEDDRDLADILKLRMETNNFQVLNFYDLKSVSWDTIDIVLGDFRNKIVAFKDLANECKKNEVPLIAISGYETTHKPQLLKPFTIEELQDIIVKNITVKKKTTTPDKKDENFSLFGLFKKSG